MSFQMHKHKMILKFIVGAFLQKQQLTSDQTLLSDAPPIYRRTLANSPNPLKAPTITETLAKIAQPRHP